MENWIKIICKKCTTPNWINDGDPNDMTHPDTMGFICHKCMEPNSMWDEDTRCPGDDDPESYEFGLENPT